MRSCDWISDVRSSALAGLRSNAVAMLCGLLDSVIDRAAYVIENAGKALDVVSRGIFGYGQKGEYDPADEAYLEDAVRKLGRIEDLTSRIRDSQIGRAHV